MKITRHIRSCSSGLAALSLVSSVAVGAAMARAEVDDDELKRIFAGVSSSFALPYTDLLVAKHDEGWRNLVDGFRGSITLGVPLVLTQEKTSIAAGAVSRTGNTPTLKSTITYSPISYWFVSSTVYLYADSRLQQEWNPDFTYVFGYDDWHPYTFSAYYSHYGGNRLFPKRGETYSDFLFGTLTVAWKFPIPQSIAEPFLIDPTGGIGCSTAYSASPRFFDLASASNQTWKQTVSFGCKYTIVGNWYVNWTVVGYVDPDQQQPWDPDFTYGFGYFDWRPGSVSIQYNNYSGNRFPWREQPKDTGHFRDGEFSVSWSWAM